MVAIELAIEDLSGREVEMHEDCEPLPIIVHKAHYDQLRAAGFTNIALSVYDLKEGASASPQE